MHKMVPFCMNTAKTILWEEPYTPVPSNTTLFDPIIYINTEIININTFQQLNTLYYVPIACKTICKT